MRIWHGLVILVLGLACSHDINRPDGYTRFQNAADDGQSCGRLLKKLPAQEGATWSDSSRQQVEQAFTSCLKGYARNETHASSLEYLKSALTTMGLNHREVAVQNTSRLIAFTDSNPQKDAVLMVHSTDLVNSQMLAQEGSTNYLWGQQRNDTKSVGMMQLLAMAFAVKSKTPPNKNLVFIATENGQFKEAVEMFPKAEIILNEGGYGFTKFDKDVFLIGSEQKGGAWLKLKHQSPSRLLSHLDQLMAVFLPHEPQDFKEPGKCQLVSFTTEEQKVNAIPYKINFQLSCKGLNELQVGQAFAHPNVSFSGKRDKNNYYISLELNYPKENPLGKLSALQVAAQGLQKLSIIPYRDWSFEEPQFYKHVRTPASADFVKTVKEVYTPQSAWGDLLWELDGSGEWSQVQSEMSADKRDGPEKMFRTSCSWTGFNAKSEVAEAFVDCRLIHTAFMKNITSSQAEAFIKQLKEKAKDPQLQIEMIKGWNYTSSDSKSEYVHIMKEEITKEYPKAQTGTWLAPASLNLESGEAKKIPSYGFYPVLKEDFLDGDAAGSFPNQQVFTANKIYSATVSRLVH